MSIILGGSGQPAPIEKDRRALPAPVMPCPKPPEDTGEGRSGSRKSAQLQAEESIAARQRDAAKMSPGELLEGLEKLAHEIAAKVGIELKKPNVETTYRQTGRFPAGIASQRHVGPITAKFLADAARAVGVELATSEELAQLRGLAGEWDKTQKMLMDRAPTSARIQELLAQDAASVGAPTYRGLTPQSAREIASASMVPLKSQLKVISREAAAVAHAVRPRLVIALQTRLAGRLEKEIAESGELEMPFHVSVYSSTIEKAIEELRRLDLTFSGECRPGAFLFGLCGLLIAETKGPQ